MQISEGFNCAILPAGIDKFDMPVSLIRVAAADSEPGLSMRRSVHVAWQYCGDFLVRVRCLLLGCSMAIDTQLCEATPVPFLLKWWGQLLLNERSFTHIASVVLHSLCKGKRCYLVLTLYCPECHMTGTHVDYRYPVEIVLYSCLLNDFFFGISKCIFPSLSLGTIVLCIGTILGSSEWRTDSWELPWNKNSNKHSNPISSLSGRPPELTKCLATQSKSQIDY